MVKNIIIAFCLFTIPLISFGATNTSNFFKASSKKITYGDSLTLKWHAPRATSCSLYSPTSKESNVPDAFGSTETITVQPDKTHSDWKQGTYATFHLVCLDESKLDKDDNYILVFEKTIKILLSKPIISKKLEKKGIDLEWTKWNKNISISMHQPKGWRMRKFGNNISFVKSFKNSTISGSLDIEEGTETTFYELKNNFTPEKILAPWVAKNIKSTSFTIGDLPALSIEYTFDKSRYKKVAFVQDGVSYFVNAQTPIQEWDTYGNILTESIKTIQIKTSSQKLSQTIQHVRPIDDTDFILGNPDAPVIVLEYSDFECPFCHQFHESMNRIMKEYGESGKVAWVFRQFPLEQLHSKAPTEALASECAAAQGGNKAFWAYADKLFSGPGNNQLDLAKLPQFASDIGIDRARFEACLKDTSESGLMKNVSDDFNDAVQSGGQGTPYTHIVAGGVVHPLGGALPYPALKAAIDLFIKNAEAGGKIMPPTTESKSTK